MQTMESKIDGLVYDINNEMLPHNTSIKLLLRKRGSSNRFNLYIQYPKRKNFILVGSNNN